MLIEIGERAEELAVKHMQLTPQAMARPMPKKAKVMAEKKKSLEE